MKPGYLGIEKIKPNPPNREKTGFKPGLGKAGLLTSSADDQPPLRKVRAWPANQTTRLVIKCNAFLFIENYSVKCFEVKEEWLNHKRP